MQRHPANPKVDEDKHLSILKPCPATNGNQYQQTLGEYPTRFLNLVDLTSKSIYY